MKCITHADFLAAKAADSYYAGRWGYIEPVAKLIEGLRLDGKSLELGPHALPLIVGGKTMDYDQKLSDVTYHHDATILPWPCEDKQFELFVALQVWEHLENCQAKCFGEVMRVAKRAILSVPYKWLYRDTNDPAVMAHYMITPETIRRWTMGIPPTKYFVVCRRIVLYYDWSALITA